MIEEIEERRVGDMYECMARVTDNFNSVMAALAFLLLTHRCPFEGVKIKLYFVIMIRNTYILLCVRACSWMNSLIFDVHMILRVRGLKNNALQLHQY